MKIEEILFGMIIGISFLMLMGIFVVLLSKGLESTGLYSEEDCIKVAKYHFNYTNPKCNYEYGVGCHCKDKVTYNGVSHYTVSEVIII